MSKFSTFNLIAGFNQVLAHLNAEENELAAQFAETLKEAQGDVYHLNDLQDRGVDNWDGYVGRSHCSECDDEGCQECEE